MKTVLNLVGGGIGGLLVFLMCLPLGLQSSYFRTLATVTVSAGVVGGVLSEELLKRWAKLSRQRVLTQAEINQLFEGLKTEYLRSSSRVDELAALQQVHDQVKEKFNAK